MTENTRHETPDVAELRRLAESATPGPWEAFGAVDGRRGERWLGVTTDMRAIESARAGDVFAAQDCTRQDALFIAAANPAAVLALLDDADALRAELAHMTEARDNARAEVERLTAQVERVRALHRAVGIYDECDCDAPDPATHLDVDDVGLTCNLMYRVCAECCRDDVYQTEDCANYHAHRLDEDYHCPTIRALDEENAQSRAPQHPNPYRQTEGNRA